jgi:hypothetical protein
VRKKTKCPSKNDKVKIGGRNSNESKILVTNKIREEKIGGDEDEIWRDLSPPLLPLVSFVRPYGLKQ